jgi:hypothetical protein
MPAGRQSGTDLGLTQKHDTTPANRNIHRFDVFQVRQFEHVHVMCCSNSSALNGA